MIGQYFDVGSFSATSNKLEELKKNNSPETLEKVATELEAMFIYELLKVMRKSVDINEKNDSALSNYNTVMDLELSKVLAERGMGLKKYIIEAFDREKLIKKYDNNQNISERKKNTFSKQDGIFKNITSGFGLRKHPIFGHVHFHKGIDIAMPEGKEIYPVAEGKVIYSGFDNGYGFNVIIDHGDGIKTRYAHNMINCVKEGDFVNKDTQIGKVGKTGITTGPHLHFEVIKNGEHVDPGTFIANAKLKF